MSNNVKLNKKGFLDSLYEKMYMHPGIKKITDGQGNIIVPQERFVEFLHDLGVLIDECVKDNCTLDK